MADQFQAGSCSSGTWWSSGFGGGPTMSASASCSTELTNVAGSFNWATASDMFEPKSRSCDESPVSISNSSVTFQDIQNSDVSAPVIAAPMLDSVSQAMDFGLSSPTVEWSQSFFSGRGQNSFHALLQEDVISRPYAQRDWGVESNQTHIPLKNLNHCSLQDHHVLLSSRINSIPLLSASHGLPSTLLQGHLEPESRLQGSFNDARTMKYESSVDCREASNDSLQTSVGRLPQFMNASPPKQQLQFSNDTPFWNPSASSVNEAHSNFHHAKPPQPFHNENSSHSKPVVKTASGARGSCPTLEKRSDSEPAAKKPRTETPSPLPTFKVRKEKLGDRITALQQLVSPFGKTDTASVLHETIEYIKFLHDQVRVLSAPYLKKDHQTQQTKASDKPKDCEGRNLNLRSRGLCLIPISSTFAVANEIPTDCWTPTFTGTFR
nr:PREDICTED: transcription factor bHLH112-like isoform X2 [Musa acuminata subsp. malaccensis]